MSEIIEIGLCVLDLSTLERTERRALFVRPERSEISAFCTELTGLRAQDVADGLSFRDACTVLRREFHADSRPWASWGDYDRKQVQAQCAAAGIPSPFSVRHINAKKVFTEAHGLNKRPGMAQALAHAGLPLEGRHHRGVDDAWNIAALVAGLVRAGGGRGQGLKGFGLRADPSAPSGHLPLRGG
ncbi:exonuclease domain-containing protein [Deinococcus multiflagellatus]|uniref:Exonuclease domain-containing protein n=1 Tax=Deinococcus multiflagellatus TaxID=1656887 RepID=A0ABW1ZM64_9DEIO